MLSAHYETKDRVMGKFNNFSDALDNEWATLGGANRRDDILRDADQYVAYALQLLEENEIIIERLESQGKDTVTLRAERTYYRNQIVRVQNVRTLLLSQPDILIDPALARGKTWRAPWDTKEGK